MDVEFPDGTAVTASPLSVQEERRGPFDFGLYMDERWAPDWEAVWIDWPDFGLPEDWNVAADRIAAAFDRARSGEKIEVGCVGGIGRTGTVLACMAILAGVGVDEAVEWVRANYDGKAVETAEQESWIAWFGRRALAGED